MLTKFSFRPLSSLYDCLLRKLIAYPQAFPSVSHKCRLFAVIRHCFHTVVTTKRTLKSQ